MVYLQQELTRTLAAVADPTRRAIVDRLARGELTIKALAEPFAMTLPAVSKHVQVLERAGLVEIRREGRSRHCRLVAEPMRDAVDWMTRYRDLWERRLDALAELVEETEEND